MNGKQTINSQNLQQHMESARNAIDKGQAQYETPLPWARAIAQGLPHNRPIITDFSAGAGNLLAGAVKTHTEALHALDIENCQNVSPHERLDVPIARCVGDLTVAWPLMKAVDYMADLIVLNPPWDLHWYRDRLKSLAESEISSVKQAWSQVDPRLGQDCIDSTVASVMMALDRMTVRGDGVVIANAATMDRLIFGPDAPYRPIRHHFWLTAKLRGNPCSPDSRGDFITGVYYFALSHNAGPRALGGALISTPEQLVAALVGVNLTQWREGMRHHGSGSGLTDATKKWKAIKQELEVQTGKRESEFNIHLDQQGLIRAHLSTYEQITLDGERGIAAKTLFRLHGQRPMSLVVQGAARKELIDTIHSEFWSVDPKLVEAVEKAVREYHSVRAPIHDLPPIQRLGYLDEEKWIKCIRPLSTLFRAGERYPVQTKTVQVQRTTRKYILDGTQHEFLMKGQELAILIDSGGQSVCFMDKRHRDSSVTVTEDEDDNPVSIDFNLQDIAAHFEIPDVPDVSTVYPEKFARLKGKMAEFQQIIREKHNPKWMFKEFQMNDIPANALHNGSILAWDTGLGKTIAAMLYPLLQVGNIPGTLIPSSPCLLISPGGLHAQAIADFKEMGIPVTLLDCQDTFCKLTAGGIKPLSPGWYISSFTQICTNKIEKINGKADMDDLRRPGQPHSVTHPKWEYDAERIGYLMARYRITTADAKKVPGTQDLWAKAIALIKSKHDEYCEGDGEVVDYAGGFRVRCSASPSLGQLSGHHFKVIVIDEATRIKSEDSLIGIGCRDLDPPYRLVMTATPVKNRLPDMFWLMWWAAGGVAEAHARFPYAGSTGSNVFEDEFLVAERDLTKEKLASNGVVKKRKKERKGRKTAEVCNIHRLWKLVAPIVSRRRKTDVGDIVSKVRRPISVPMGAQQARVYDYHMNAEYVDSRGREAAGARLMALRSVAAAPHSALLKRDPGDRFSNDEHVPYRSLADYTPKIAAALTVIRGCLERREQVAVFSGIREPNDTVGRRLQQCGIPFVAMDGRVTEKKRGELSRKFKEGLEGGIPISLNGLGSMSEGHNWFRCRNVIILAYDWAFNLFEQAINRVHRMTSEFDVNVWPIVCEGTVELKLESLLAEKADSSELVLDGSLMGERVDEMNYFEMLQAATEVWQENKSDFEDEAILQKRWPALKRGLIEAWANCLKPESRREAEPTVLKDVVLHPAQAVQRIAEQMTLQI